MNSVPTIRGCTIFQTRVIRQRLSLKIIVFSMGLQHGGRKPVETSWVYFRARNMLPRNNVLLFLCTDCCSVAPLLRCSVAPFLRSSVPLFLCSSIPPFLCSSVPLFLCSSVPLFLCSSVPMFLCSSVRSSVRLFPCCSFPFCLLLLREFLQLS